MRHLNILGALALAACSQPPEDDEPSPESVADANAKKSEVPASPPPAKAGAGEDAKPQPSMFIDAVGAPAEPEACYAYAAETCKWLKPARPNCQTEVQTVLVKAKIDAGVCSVALKSLALIDSDEPNVKPSAAARFLQEALLTSPDVDLAAARAGMAQ